MEIQNYNNDPCLSIAEFRRPIETFLAYKEPDPVHQTFSNETFMTLVILVVCGYYSSNDWEYCL